MVQLNERRKLTDEAVTSLTVEMEVYVPLGETKKSRPMLSLGVATATDTAVGTYARFCLYVKE